MQLDELVESAVREALSSESISERVKQAADKAVTEAIERAFGYSGKFRKSVEEAIANVLPLPRENDLINFAMATQELLQSRLSVLATESASTHLAKMLDKLIPSEPVIDLNDIRDCFEKHVGDQLRLEDGCECHEHKELEYFWEVEVSDRGHWYIYAAVDSDASRYSGKTTQLAFKTDDDGLFTCWSVKYGSEPLKATVFQGVRFGWDLLLYQLLSGILRVRK